MVLGVGQRGVDRSHCHQFMGEAVVAGVHRTIHHEGLAVRIAAVGQQEAGHRAAEGVDTVSQGQGEGVRISDRHIGRTVESPRLHGARLRRGNHAEHTAGGLEGGEGGIDVAGELDDWAVTTRQVESGEVHHDREVALGEFQRHVEHFSILHDRNGDHRGHKAVFNGGGHGRCGIGITVWHGGNDDHSNQPIRDLRVHRAGFTAHQLDADGIQLREPFSEVEGAGHLANGGVHIEGDFHQLQQRLSTFGLHQLLQIGRRRRRGDAEVVDPELLSTDAELVHVSVEHEPAVESGDHRSR